MKLLRGQSLLEYAIIMSLFVAAAVGAITSFFAKMDSCVHADLTKGSKCP